MKLVVKNAQYIRSLFSILSNGVIGVSYLSGTLKLSNRVAGNYDFALTNGVLPKVYSVKSNPGTKLPVHSICIGRTVDGHAIVLDLRGNGLIRRFNKSGNTLDLTTYTTGLAQYKITVSKGAAVTLDFTNINEVVVNGLVTINKSLFPDFARWAVGGLVTGAVEEFYIIE